MRLQKDLKQKLNVNKSNMKNYLKQLKKLLMKRHKQLSRQLRRELDLKLLCNWVMKHNVQPIKSYLKLEMMLNRQNLKPIKQMKISARFQIIYQTTCPQKKIYLVQKSQQNKLPGKKKPSKMQKRQLKKLCNRWIFKLKI